LKTATAGKTKGVARSRIRRSVRKSAPDAQLQDGALRHASRRPCPESPDPAWVCKERFLLRAVQPGWSGLLRLKFGSGRRRFRHSAVHGVSCQWRNLRILSQPLETAVTGALNLDTHPEVSRRPVPVRSPVPCKTARFSAVVTNMPVAIQSAFAR
jgi:hypothetical protein